MSEVFPFRTGLPLFTATRVPVLLELLTDLAALHDFVFNRFRAFLYDDTGALLLKPFMLKDDVLLPLERPRWGLRGRRRRWRW